MAQTSTTSPTIPSEPLRARGELFDLAPVGLCLLRHGQPLYINRRFAFLLGGDESDTRLSPDELLKRWPDVWPQLGGLQAGHRLVAFAIPGRAPFNGRAFSQPTSKARPEEEIITLVSSRQIEWMSFSSDWRARMLAQTEFMCRSGSAEIDLDTGRAALSVGLGALVGHPSPGTPIAAWRMLRWVPREERRHVASIWGAAITDEPFEFQHRVAHVDGSRLVVLNRGMVEVGPDGHRHAYMIVQDITAQREAEQRIQELANHDEVTGLANRSLLLDRMDAVVHSASWDPRPFTLLSIDVKQIGHLVRAMGYGAGDAMAMAVAARLSELAGPSDVVARIGSSEFAVLLSQDTCAHEGASTAMAEKVVRALSVPERLGAVEIVPGAEVGMASFPADADGAGELLEAAQSARLGGPDRQGQTSSFTPEIRAQALRRLAIESGLRYAVDRGELTLRYQLQADLTTGEAVAMDAVPRWQSHELGEVPVGEFMTVARKTGLVVMIGEWQRREVCRQLQQWMAQGMKPLRVVVGLSALELQRPDIVSDTLSMLASSGVAASLMGLAVTEHSLVTGSQDMPGKLAELRAAGVEITLRDFATGYSNLSQLRTLPVDVLRIDRTCVPDVTAGVGEVSLTRAIINMAHGLRMKVMAEGVTSEGQLTLLVANGCDRMIGDVFSPPVDAQGLFELRQRHTRLPERFMRRPRERTLLLVDDEPNIVSSLKRLFRRDGYRIVTANSGAEGLERMAEYEVDVVLSDQRMPGMTGVEFLRRAKELYPATVRMVLSGYTELQSITDAINEGAIYRFLTKPWDDEQLRKHVQEAFLQKVLVDENRQLSDEARKANEELALVNGRLERVLAAQQQRIQVEEVRAANARDMLDLLPVPVLGIDPHGMLGLVNREAQDLFGPGLLLGQQARDVLPPPLRPLLQAEGAPDEVRLPWRGRGWRARIRPWTAVDRDGHLLVLTEICDQVPCSE